MNRRVRIATLVFALFLLFGSSAYADGESQGIGPTSGTCGSKLTWTLSTDGKLTISGTGAMSNYSSSAGTPWEARKSAVKTVVIGSGVTSVGDCAFSGCVNLRAVNLPNGLKTIGNSAFSSCTALVNIAFPNTVTSIGENCFHSCENLKNITLSSTLASIGSNAFYHCRTLTTIELPDSVTTIGSYAFQYCISLQTITLSSGMTSISSRCFESCQITDLTIPEGITSIGSYAFSYNNTLSTLYLPSSMENVFSCAFINCDNLSDVYFNGTQAEAEAIPIGTGNTCLSSATWHFASNPQHVLTTLTLPNMLSTIESEAFSGVSAQMIVVPASVNEIESRAFADCANLETLYFEGAPYSIASDILSGCNNVTVSVIPGSSAEKWAIRFGFTIAYH